MGSRNDIQDVTLLPADVGNEVATDWMGINSLFSVKIVGSFTGTITLQRRNSDDDATGNNTVGDVKNYTAPAEEAGEGRLTRGMEYRLIAKAGAVTAIPTSVYIAIIK